MDASLAVKLLIGKGVRPGAKVTVGAGASQLAPLRAPARTRTSHFSLFLALSRSLSLSLLSHAHAAVQAILAARFGSASRTTHRMGS